MSWKAIGSAALVALFVALTATDSWSRDGEKMYVVDLYGRRDIEADAAKKLAPALLATKDAGGILKGSDDLGRPVIAVPSDKVDAIRKSRAVRSISSEIPKDWRPVRRLKLSYRADLKPDGDELKKLGLKLVEDYPKGRFLIVEPLDGLIDAKLATRLEGCPQVEYAAPLFEVRATQPPER